MNIKNSSGETPFSYACAYKQLDAAKLLFERGADINTTYSSDGETPLDTALGMRSMELSDWLLSIGAKRGEDFKP